MGNKNNKLKKLSKLTTTPPTIDELPVEIIYKILDSLDICTIFTSLYHVCKRFDEILLTYNKYNLNLQNISLKNLNIICSRIHSEQITELTLFDDENNSNLIELFLSKFSIDKFLYLHSLTLIKINNEEFINKILISIADHRLLLNFSSLKIINTYENYDDLFVEIIMSILTKPSLREVYLDLSYNRTTSNPLPWLEESSIQHLTFKGTCTVSFIRNTFICVPQLRTLKIDDLDFDEEIDLNYISNNENFDSSDEENENENQSLKKVNFISINSPNNLTSLILNTCTMNMLQIEWLLEEILTLKHLCLLTTNNYDDESILDGQRWEKLVKNLNKFQFIFFVNLSINSKWDFDICISKFQTSFWIEEKQWFISLEKYDEEIILYTLPYSNNSFVIKNQLSSFDYRSTENENSKLQIQSMNNVKDLYIDVSTMKISPFENIISPRFLHVTNLSLYGKWSKSKTFFNDLKTIVNLNNIEEFIRDESIPTMDFMTLLNLMPNLQTIKTSINLLDALNAAKFSYKKCLHSFIIDSNIYIEQRPINIEPFCDMFPRIENLIIPIDNVDSCRYAIENLNQDLKSVIFRIPIDDISSGERTDNEEEENSTLDPYSEWIKELPKQYRCHKQQQQIQIWLK